jgi:hypothetical protein
MGIVVMLSFLILRGGKYCVRDVRSGNAGIGGTALSGSVYEAVAVLPSRACC